jgi:hypothetical protein
MVFQLQSHGGTKLLTTATWYLYVSVNSYTGDKVKSYARSHFCRAMTGELRTLPYLLTGLTLQSAVYASGSA